MSGNLLTQKEVCALLRVSPSTLQKMRRDRHLPFVQFGYRTIRFKREVVEAYAKQHEICAKECAQ